MQNSSYDIGASGTTTRYWHNGQTAAPVTTWYSTAGSASFGFTGFGANPDRRHKLPVAGAYVKRFWSGCTGQRTFIDRWYSQGYTDVTIGYQSSFSAWLIQNYRTMSTVSILSNQTMNWVYNECLDKLYEQIKQTETNIALTLGEGKETGRMLKVFKSVDKVVSAIRKARKEIKRNPTLLLAKTHLSIKYGWMPLFNDIWNYANWTQKQFASGIPIRARRRKRFKVLQTATQYGINARLTGEESFSCEIGLTANVSDPDWFTTSRLTSLNPASIVWELTTLSFVVDWLYDIGGYLENLEASLGCGLTFQHGYVTRTYTNSMSEYNWYYSISGSPFNPNGTGQLEDKSGTTLSRWTLKRRDLLTSFPRPVKPTFKLRMGSGRILSAAALSRTILLGGVKGRNW